VVTRREGVDALRVAAAPLAPMSRRIVDDSEPFWALDCVGLRDPGP
jgi:hypothetical protein